MNCTIGRVFGIIAAWTALTVFSLMCACSHSAVSMDGGGSRGGNPVVTGKVVMPSGAGARNVKVSLIAQDFNPLADVASQLCSIDTTDSLGRFSIAAPDTGWFNVEAVGIADGGRLIRFDVKALRDSVTVMPADTLRRPGALKVALPSGSSASDGYVYVPGTSIASVLAGFKDTVVLDSVPSGTFPVLYYAQRKSTARKALRHDITIRPNETTLIGHPEWSYCRRVNLNTSPSGASVSADVYGFPVLIRLNSGNFDFTQARSGGGDLMFAGSGNSSLPFEIERWNASNGRTEIWVRVDTVFGNNDSQFITMYWGATTMDSAGAPQGSVSPSNGAAVFDTASGFQGVWHLGDGAQDSVRDATVNRYHGISPDGARPTVAEGIIGNCRLFDGITDFITMPNTADGKLSFPQNGNYTVSAWVSLDTFDNAPHCIVSKGYEQYFLRTTYFPSTSPSWEFVEFDETTDWQSSRYPATARQWIFLVGVRQGSSQSLYCNGVLADSAKDVWPRGISRNTSNDLSIGKFLKTITVPNNDGYCYFKGLIDEVRIIGTARSPDWVRLCYMNQRSDDRLVVFK